MVTVLTAVITNHPQDITVCVNKYANIPCGFTGADPDETNWHILKWDGNGGIASFDTVSVTEINRNTTDGLVWVPDQHNGNNSCLIVGPVTKADNCSTYQCNLNDTTFSNVGTLTVLGEFTVYITKQYNDVLFAPSLFINPLTQRYITILLVCSCTAWLP